MTRKRHTKIRTIKKYVIIPTTEHAKKQLTRKQVLFRRTLHTCIILASIVLAIVGYRIGSELFASLNMTLTTVLSGYVALAETRV